LTNVSDNASEQYDEAKSVEGEVNTSVRDNRVGNTKEWEVFQFDLVTQIAKHPVVGSNKHLSIGNTFLLLHFLLSLCLLSIILGQFLCTRAVTVVT
jgi:hypothetical protein